MCDYKSKSWGYKFTLTRKVRFGFMGKKVKVPFMTHFEIWCIYSVLFAFIICAQIRLLLCRLVGVRQEPGKERKWGGGGGEDSHFGRITLHTNFKSRVERFIGEEICSVRHRTFSENKNLS